MRLARLANIGKGLIPASIRQIYLACVTSVADYGSVIWWKGQKALARPLQALQNLALRKILGVFKTAPISAIEVEAALPPAEIRLNSNTHQYIFRLLKLAKNHLVNIALIKNIDIRLEDRIKHPRLNL